MMMFAGGRSTPRCVAGFLVTVRDKGQGMLAVVVMLVSNSLKLKNDSFLPYTFRFIFVFPFSATYRLQSKISTKKKKTYSKS